MGRRAHAGRSSAGDPMLAADARQKIGLIPTDAFMKTSAFKAIEVDGLRPVRGCKRHSRPACDATRSLGGWSCIGRDFRHGINLFVSSSPFQF